MLSGFRSRWTHPVADVPRSSASPIWSRRSATSGSAGRGFAFWKGGQRLSVEKLHHQVRQVRARADLRDSKIGDVDDVGMTQPAAGLRFPVEPSEEMRIGGPTSGRSPSPPQHGSYQDGWPGTRSPSRQHQAAGRSGTCPQEFRRSSPRPDCPVVMIARSSSESILSPELHP